MSEIIGKNEFAKNNEIVLGISCYTEKASRRLSAFKNLVRWAGKEKFIFQLLTLFLNLPKFKKFIYFIINT
jgi:hypothetical protein